jgi:hypothetical protein
MARPLRARVALSIIGILAATSPYGYTASGVTASPQTSLGANFSGLQVVPKPPVFASEHFERVWTRTDYLVASGAVRRSWYWGPWQNSGPVYEEFEGGTRLVQYFDKTRMEINDPNANPNSQWYVTNGLLTRELISGEMQTGNNKVVKRSPAPFAIAGDGDDANAPTYGSFLSVTSSGGTNQHPQPNRLGQFATATINKAGQVGNDPSKSALPGTRIVRYDNSHNVPEVFSNFLSMSDDVIENGRRVTKAINDPWFYATGFAISDAYWAKVKVAGVMRDALIQAFERRVLI